MLVGLLLIRFSFAASGVLRIGSPLLSLAPFLLSALLRVAVRLTPLLRFAVLSLIALLAFAALLRLLILGLLTLVARTVLFLIALLFALAAFAVLRLLVALLPVVLLIARRIALCEAIRRRLLFWIGRHDAELLRRRLGRVRDRCAIVIRRDPVIHDVAGLQPVLARLELISRVESPFLLQFQQRHIEHIASLHLAAQPHFGKRKILIAGFDFD